MSYYITKPSNIFTILDTTASKYFFSNGFHVNIVAMDNPVSKLLEHP